MASADLTINQNVAKCFRDVSNLGSTTVYNACTGTHMVVPWGVFDWLSAIGLLLFICAAAAIVIAVFVATERARDRSHP